jgi:hypothetical protein
LFSSSEVILNGISCFRIGFLFTGGEINIHLLRVLGLKSCHSFEALRSLYRRLKPARLRLQLCF